MKTAGKIAAWVMLGCASTEGLAAPLVVPDGHAVEAYVTGLRGPIAMAFSPGGGFGHQGELFVADVWTTMGTIYRVPRKGEKVVFAGNVAGGAVAMAFPPPGSKFGPFLYVLAHGPPLWRYDAKGVAKKLGDTSGHCLGLSFGPGGSWGEDLFCLDSARNADVGEGVCRWTPDGKMTRMVDRLREDLAGMAFGPGGGFGTDLYLCFADWAGGGSWPRKEDAGIYRMGPDGKPRLFVKRPDFKRTIAIAFDSTWNFRGSMFVTDYSVGTIFEIDPDGKISTFLTGLSKPSPQWEWASGDIAFGPDGAMYVLDSGRGTVWRIAFKGPLARRSDRDVVVLARRGAVVGTLSERAYTLDTILGRLKLPAERVVGMVAGPADRARFVLSDGQRVSAKIPDGALTIKLPDGTTREIPFRDIQRWSYRISARRPFRAGPDGPALQLQSGDLLAYDPNTFRLVIPTAAGPQALPASRLLRVQLTAAPKPGARLWFANGSIVRWPVLSGHFRPRLAPKKKLSLTAHGVDLRFSTAPRDPGPMIRMTLTQGDVLVGRLAAESVKFQSLYGDVVLKLSDFRTLGPSKTRPGMLSVTLTNGSVLAGRLAPGKVPFELSQGPTLTIPAKRITGILPPGAKGTGK